MKKLAFSISLLFASTLANADSLVATGLSSPIGISGFSASPYTALNPVSYIQTGTIKTQGAGMVEAVYLGSESANNDTFTIKFGFGNTLFETNAIGKSVDAYYGANDALDFFFMDLTDGTLGVNGSNRVGILYQSSLLPAYSHLGPFDFFLGFNDNTRRSGNKDYDDFVVGLRYKPSAVPVPAAVWLMGSAMIGFGSLRRRKILG